MCNCTERRDAISDAGGWLASKALDGIDWMLGGRLFPHKKRHERTPEEDLAGAIWAIEDRLWREGRGAAPVQEAYRGQIIDITEEGAMPKCDATIKHMIEVGRAWLQANPGKPATAYEVKQIMALAEPQHNALQQSKAICTLLVEFSGKK